MSVIAGMKGVYMAILMNNFRKNSTGFAANKAARQALVDALYRHTVVIPKIEIVVDKKTDEVSTISKYGTIGINPIVEKIGLEYDKTMNNIPVEVALENTNDKTECRRIDIDGDKYIFTENVIMIKCDDEKLVEKHDAYGFIYKDRLYKVLAASPSNEKKAVKFFYNTNVLATERAAFNLVDSVAGHVFSDKFRNKLSGKEITKLNTRFGNYLTTMILGAEIDLEKDYIAVIHKEKKDGKVVKEGAMIGAYDFDDATREAMDNAGVSIDNHINDGAKINTVELVQEIFAGLNVELSIEDALKVALQQRETMMTSKVMGITMTQEDALVMAESNKAEFYGNRAGRLMGVYDEDGAKLMNMTALRAGKGKIKVYILAMAKASNVRTNGQHLIKYMAVNPEETIDFLKKQFNFALDKFLVGKINNDNPMTDTVNARLIAALHGEAVNNTALMSSLVDDIIKYSRSAIAKTQVEIDGIYSHMSFDMTYSLTNGAISSLLDVTPEGIVEAYSADINRKLAKETKAIEENPNLTEEDKMIELFNLRTGVVIKHPSAMPDEYELVYYMTEKQMKQRIIDKLNAVKDNKVKSMLKKTDAKARLTRYVDNAPWGVTIYAPLNAMKNKLAGADVDFDATLTDMSELKHILIKDRLTKQKDNLGYMGNCVFISYKDIDRSNMNVSNCDDIDL